jgi:hypothetical protein
MPGEKSDNRRRQIFKSLKKQEFRRAGGNPSGFGVVRLVAAG